MSFYEHVIIARPDVSAQQIETLTADFTKIVEAGGAKVTKSEYWGLRTLAYKIKKNRKAHYMFLNIDGPHPAVAEMERLERLNEDILRFMTIRVDELEEGPSIMMQAKTDRRPRRDDRGPRRDDRGPRRDAPAPAATAPAAAAPAADAAATPAESKTEATAAPAEKKTDAAATPAEKKTEAAAAPTEKKTDAAATPAETKTEATAAPAEKKTDAAATPAETKTEATAAPAEKKTEATAAPEAAVKGDDK